jgi:hypothetical protein
LSFQYHFTTKDGKFDFKNTFIIITNAVALAVPTPDHPTQSHCIAMTNPIFSGYMEPVGSKHNLAGEWALVIFQFCKILRPDFI